MMANVDIIIFVAEKAFFVFSSVAEFEVKFTIVLKCWFTDTKHFKKNGIRPIAEIVAGTRCD
jgi:hypothetical protein